MPRILVSGREYQGVQEGDVSIVNSSSNTIPTCQIAVKLVTSNDITLAQWALAQPGPNRFKKVELRTDDASGGTNHIWTLLNAYVVSYEETDAPELANDPVTASQARQTRLLLQGVPSGKVDYDGRNILNVAAGSGPLPPPT